MRGYARVRLSKIDARTRRPTDRTGIKGGHRRASSINRFSTSSQARNNSSQPQHEVHRSE